MKYTVLVTGAGGFVGRHIVDALLMNGFRVLVADTQLDNDAFHDWSKRDFEWVAVDVAHLPNSPVDYVIHAAAITADAHERGESALDNFKANAYPLLDVLEWSQAQQVRRVIFISSTGVFRGLNDAVLSDDEPTIATGMYAVAKTMGEGLIRTLKTEFGQDMLTVRLGSVFGANEQPRGTRPRVSLVRRLIENAVTTGVMQVPTQSWRMDWTFAPDIGQALCALLKATHLQYPTYNVTSGWEVNTLEIAQVIQQVLPETRITFAEADAGMFRGYAVGEHLLNELGFAAWTPFEEGIRQTVQSVLTATRSHAA